MHDILIKNGTVIDGSGRPRFEADIAISEDRITEIGKLAGDKADKVIDAKGKIICPGFVDVSNRSDVYWQLFENPHQESLLYQGITTIIGGNSGSSLAPLASVDAINTIQKWADMNNVHPDWHTMKEYLTYIDEHKTSLNYGTLVGHATLRRALTGDEHRALTDKEIKQMQKMLRAALKGGGIGLSTGLLYTHARATDEREIEALLSVVKEFDAIYAVHLRDEGQYLPQALDEALLAAQTAKVRLHVTHLKAVGENNWHLMDEAIGMIEMARAEGVVVMFDVYPYTATGSVLYAFLPEWVSEGGKKMMLGRLRNPSIRMRVEKELENADVDFAQAIVSISSIDETLAHRYIGEIAQRSGQSIETTVIDLLLATEGRVIVIMDQALHEENVARAIAHPFSVITSNSAGYSEAHRTSGAVIHPRSFGAFPHVLAEYVKDRHILNWEAAIHKMSGKPSEYFGLKERGLLRTGYYADIIVLDPESVQDRATIADPYQYAQGIEWLLVNGQISIAKSVYNSKMWGKALRRDK